MASAPRTLRLILGDQLSHDIAALAGGDKNRDVVLMAEVMAEASYVPHHRKKLAFIFSAMRHFAAELADAGWHVRYIRLDASANTGSLGDEVARALGEETCRRLIVTEAGEWRLAEEMSGWSDRFGCEVIIREDVRFLVSHAAFSEFASRYKGLLMETFYRETRRKHGILLAADGKPESGRWNFDAENRKRLPRAIVLPPRKDFAPDDTTREVIEMVAHRFPANFGDIEPFDLPVTRVEALEHLAEFIDVRLPSFGEYQDAMTFDEPTLFHSRLSAAINIGLLSAIEVVRAAETAYRSGHAPLNSVEGFIRQIIGWREYVRGVYWLRMPHYAQLNHFDARVPLPGFYWSGKTDMACVADTVETTRRYAFAHHIQRLMVTGNFAMLAGIAPDEVAMWYLAVYCDAYEWVELPNVAGMGIYSDGGVMATKPYAASGAYINRMSDYCGRCRYDVKQRIGPNACPFNALYWNFLDANRDKLGRNTRLAMPYRTLDRMSAADIAALREQARGFIASLSPDY